VTLYDLEQCMAIKKLDISVFGFIKRAGRDVFTVGPIQKPYILYIEPLVAL